MLNVKDYDSGEHNVIMTEKAFKEATDMWMWVGVGIGSVGTIIGLTLFLHFFVTH